MRTRNGPSSRIASRAGLLLTLLAATAAATLPYTPLFWIDPPAEMTNGEPAPTTGLVYRLYCGDGVITNAPRLMYEGTEPQWQSAIDSFAPGDYECAATVAVGDGPQSGYSNVEGFTIAAPAPLPPTLRIE